MRSEASVRRQVKWCSDRAELWQQRDLLAPVAPLERRRDWRRPSALLAALACPRWTDSWIESHLALLVSACGCGPTGTDARATPEVA